MPTLNITDNKGNPVDLAITGSGKLPAPANLGRGDYLNISFRRNAKTYDFHLEVSNGWLQLRGGESARAFAKQLAFWIPRQIPVKPSLYDRFCAGLRVCWEVLVWLVTRAEGWRTIAATVQGLAVVASAAGLGFGLFALYIEMQPEASRTKSLFLGWLESWLGTPMEVMVYSVFAFAFLWFLASGIEFFARVSGRLEIR